MTSLLSASITARCSLSLPWRRRMASYRQLSASALFSGFTSLDSMSTDSGPVTIGVRHQTNQIKLFQQFHGQQTICQYVTLIANPHPVFSRGNLEHKFATVNIPLTIKLNKAKIIWRKATSLACMRIPIW